MRFGKSRVGAGAAALLLVWLPGIARAALPCDEFDPFGPARGAQVTLDSSAFVDQLGDEMRSFIATDSIGKVDIAVVSASPPGVVLGVSAVPEISRFSPYYGEELKGIAIAVALAGGGPARIVLDLRQVCAKQFRNTFLYY